MGIDPITAAIAAPIVGSVAGSIFGGSGAPSAPQTNVYQPSGTATVDSQLQQLLTRNFNNVSGSNNPFTQYNPQILQTFQSLFNSPSAGGYQSAGGNAGQAFTNIGNQGVGAGGQISNAAMGLLPGAMNVMNLGLDPQSALYNQMLQKATDTGNVTNAMYGLTGQQAAGNVAQDINQFNQSWQDNQLQRAISGLGAGGTAIDRAGTGATAGQNIGSAGATSVLAGGATPYQTGQTIGGNQENALMQLLSQLMGPTTSSESTIGNLGSYLGQGIGASQAGANQSLQDYYAQLQGTTQGGIGGFLGGQALGKLFGGTQAQPASNGYSSGSNFSGGDIANLMSSFSANGGGFGPGEFL